MVEKQSKRILPQLFSCIQKQKDITVITLLTIRKYQSIAFCIVKLPFWNMVIYKSGKTDLRHFCCKITHN